MRPLLSGSLASLAGCQPGDKILLDLSGRDLVGRNVHTVAPPPAVVAGKPGALYVDASDKSGWTSIQKAAYVALDALEERLDHACDLTHEIGARARARRRTSA